MRFDSSHYYNSFAVLFLGQSLFCLDPFSWGLRQLKERSKVSAFGGPGPCRATTRCAAVSESVSESRPHRTPRTRSAAQSAGRDTRALCSECRGERCGTGPSRDLRDAGSRGRQGGAPGGPLGTRGPTHPSFTVPPEIRRLDRLARGRLARGRLAIGLGSARLGKSYALPCLGAPLPRPAPFHPACPFQSQRVTSKLLPSWPHRTSKVVVLAPAFHVKSHVEFQMATHVKCHRES